jgi:hypothetical protein
MPCLHSGRFSGCVVGYVVQVADAALAEGPSKVKPSDEKEKAPNVASPEIASTLAGI